MRAARRWSLSVPVCDVRARVRGRRAKVVLDDSLLVYTFPKWCRIFGIAVRG